MSFNFPSNPTQGQEFTAITNGLTYVYINTQWVIKDQDAPNDGKTYGRKNKLWQEVASNSYPDAIADGVAYVRRNNAWLPAVQISDTVPSSPYVGQIWWESDTGSFYIYYNDGDSSQWVQVTATNQPLLTADAKNSIVNPNFQMSQRNGSTLGANSGFSAADGFYMSYNLSAGAVSFQRILTSTPNGSAYRLRMTCTSQLASLTSTDRLIIWHAIEGSRMYDCDWGRTTAKQVVFKFGFRGPAGEYAITVQNYGVQKSYIAKFTITAGQANQDTEQVFVIPGETTSGQWNYGISGAAYVQIVPVVGTARQGVAGWQNGDLWGLPTTSNFMATVNNVLEIWDVGFYRDPLSTGLPPKWVGPTMAEVERDCYRLWWQMPLIVDTTTVCQSLIYPIPMRVAPTISGGAAGFTVGNPTNLGGTHYQTTRAYQTLTFDATL